MLKPLPTRIVITAGGAVSALVLAGCWPFSSSPDKQGLPTPPATVVTTPATTPAASPTTSGMDYCTAVIKVNTDAGTMVNKVFTPVSSWTRAQVQQIADFTLDHHAEFLAITPPELKADIELELQFWQAVKDAGYDMAAPNAPAGIGEASKHIVAYQKTHCGIQ